MADLLISITHGGEALSLAASAAVLREYREKDVQAYLWKQGGRLMESMNKIASEVGVPMEWGGYPPIPMYRFIVSDQSLADDLMKLWLQEDSKGGILYRRGGPAYFCFSHSDEDIGRIIEVSEEVMVIIKDALNSGDVTSRLRVNKSIEQWLRGFA